MTDIKTRLNTDIKMLNQNIVVAQIVIDKCFNTMHNNKALDFVLENIKKVGH